MLPLDSIAANALGALLAAFCLWLLSALCPPLRRIFCGVWGAFRCALRCRSIAREHAELKAALTAKEAELLALRQELEHAHQAHDIAQQRLGVCMAQLLQAVLQANNTWRLADGQVLRDWPIAYEAHIISRASERGLLHYDPRLRVLSVTPEGIDLLIATGRTPTPQ